MDALKAEPCLAAVLARARAFPALIFDDHIRAFNSRSLTTSADDASGPRAGAEWVRGCGGIVDEARGEWAGGRGGGGGKSCSLSFISSMLEELQELEGLESSAAEISMARLMASSSLMTAGWCGPGIWKEAPTSPIWGGERGERVNGK
jgi:hypothetical protein